MGRERKSETLYIGVHEDDAEIAEVRLFGFPKEGVKVRKDTQSCAR